MEIDYESKGKEAMMYDIKQNDDTLPWFIRCKFIIELILNRVEKYRPESLKGIVSHQDIILTSSYKDALYSMIYL